MILDIQAQYLRTSDRVWRNGGELEVVAAYLQYDGIVRVDFKDNKRSYLPKKKIVTVRRGEK